MLLADVWMAFVALYTLVSLLLLSCCCVCRYYQFDRSSFLYRLPKKNH